MVFGGVVHERLQLNEDTLWAGRPYDPVNPDAKAALPEVRRLLTEGRYGDAAALAGKSVMAKPLVQMPYQTLGDLGLTFARRRGRRALPARPGPLDGHGARVVHDRQRHLRP